MGILLLFAKCGNPIGLVPRPHFPFAAQPIETWYLSLPLCWYCSPHFSQGPPSDQIQRRCFQAIQQGSLWSVQQSPLVFPLSWWGHLLSWLPWFFIFLFSQSFSDIPSLLSSHVSLVKPSCVFGAPRGPAFSLQHSLHTELCLLPHLSPYSTPLDSVALRSSCLLILTAGTRYISQRNIPALGLQGEGLSFQRREWFP